MAYLVSASAFDADAPAPAVPELTAEQKKVRKAAKAARKAAKEEPAAAAKEAVVAAPASPAAAAPAPKLKKRKAAAPPTEAAEPPAKAACAAAAPRLSNAEYRKAHEIKVADDCAAVFQTFEEAGFPPALTAALASAFPGPTPIQAVSWPLALAGRDLVAVAKTGSGKTCGYLLPGLARLAAAGGPQPPPRSEPQPGGWWKTDPVAPTVCVLAPTRELAVQIAEEAVRFATPLKAHVVCVYGGTDKGGQLRAMRGGCDVVVATPGRLNDFLEPPAGRTPPLTCRSVSYLVLDEADRMLDMGFEPQIRTIVAACKPSADRTTLLFTATWPKGVAAMAARFTSKTAAQVRIGDNGNKLVVNTSVAQHVLVLPTEAAKMPTAAKLLKEKLGPDDRAIVFCGTKRRCELLTAQLRAAGLPVAGAIHGDKTQHEREAALQALRSGTRRVLVATDVAARGIDVPGVSIVLVLDFPREVADYVHRVGRTGRAGATGAAYTLLTSADSGIARPLLALIRASQPDAAVPKELEAWAAAPKKGGAGGGGGQRGSPWRGGGGGGRGGGRGGGGRGGGGRGGGGRKW